MTDKPDNNLTRELASEIIRLGGEWSAEVVTALATLYITALDAQKNAERERAEMHSKVRGYLNEISGWRASAEVLQVKLEERELMLKLIQKHLTDEGFEAYEAEARSALRDLSDVRWEKLNKS